MSLTELIQSAQDLANPKRAHSSAWFFQTAPGQYGEGDQFLGLNMPDCRRLAKQHQTLTQSEVVLLLERPEHELRMIALLIWCYQYPHLNFERRSEIYKQYLASAHRVNNWDLVDLSAPTLVGSYLYTYFTSKQICEQLSVLAHSKLLWERRIAMLACFYGIRHEQYLEGLMIAQILVTDHHDLIRKAVGWMLREIGKRDLQLERNFLDDNMDFLSRITIYYAIEKMSQPERKKYLNLKKSTPSVR